MTNKLLKVFNNCVFALTNLLFITFPVALILIGSFIPIFVFGSWFFDQNVNLDDLWIIFIGLIMIAMGFQWDNVIINNYKDAVERKKNGEYWESEKTHLKSSNKLS